MFMSRCAPKGRPDGSAIEDNADTCHATFKPRQQETDWSRKD
jgi:hypothetical protein